MTYSIMKSLRCAALIGACALAGCGVKPRSLDGIVDNGAQGRPLRSVEDCSKPLSGILVKKRREGFGNDPTPPGTGSMWQFGSTNGSFYKILLDIRTPDGQVSSVWLGYLGYWIMNSDYERLNEGQPVELVPVKHPNKPRCGEYECIKK